MNSTDWMRRYDAAEIPLSPEEEFERQVELVAARTGIQADDHVATGDGESPWWLPWQKTSTILPGKMTIGEALEHSHLANWDLHKAPLTVIGSDDPIPGYYGVRRSSDGKVLGVVQGRYMIISNEDAFGWAEYLLGGDGSMFTSAGSLKGGRIVFLVASTPFTVNLPVNSSDVPDTLETYLLISNRHDGSGQITCAIVTVRVVCANTLERSLAGAMSTIRIRHTRRAADRLGEARRVLGLAQGATDRAEKIARDMMSARMAPRQVAQFIADLLPVPTDEVTSRQTKAIMRRREQIEDVYYTHPTVTMLDQTAWRAYNAVTFVNDHMTPRRHTNRESPPEENRQLAILNGNNLGTRAFELLANRS